MTISQILEMVAGSLGLTGISVVSIWLFGREWVLMRLKESIKSQYDHMLEDYKSKLRFTSDVELENLKSRLAGQASERNIKMTRVFDKQAEVIATIYRIIVEIEDAANDYASYLGKEEGHQESAVKRFQEKRREFFAFYEPNQIYLPMQTRESIRHLVNSLHSLVITTSHLQQAAKMGSDAGFESRNLKLNLLFEEVPKLRQKLDNEFQKVLGLQTEVTQMAPKALTESRVEPVVIVECQTNQICSRSSGVKS